MADKERKTLCFNIEGELDKKIRKLSKLTDFSRSHICREILRVSFKNGIAKDLFFLYMKDLSDPFLDEELVGNMNTTLALKEAFTTIRAIFTTQEHRLVALEKKNGKEPVRTILLTKFIEEVKQE